jgi:uncharacterized protein (DUF952 family)
LGENLFTGSIPHLWDLRELILLYIDSNQLTGTLNWEVMNLDKLVAGFTFARELLDLYNSI